MSRFLPYPVLTAGLLAMWLLLTSFSPGQLLVGAIVAVMASRAMAALEPSKPHIRRWSVIPKLIGVVTLDIMRSNVAVFLTVIGASRRTRQSGFVAIPLDLRDKSGLAILSCIVTSTPGTAWVEYDPDSGVLLLHVLDLVDPDEWVDVIKNRYEAPLREIFE